MKRLYTLVVVLFLVIIFMTMQRTSLVERFTYSKNKDIYDTDLTNINDPYPIRYRTMNAQQMIYWELIKLFQKLSNVKQKTLHNCTYELYKPETITPEVQDELNEITDRIMKTLRKNSQYAFVRNTYSTYDNIGQYIDQQGNVRYVYDVFVQDPIESFELRLKIDVIKYVAEADVQSRNNKEANSQIQTCAQATRPAFPTYPIGYPQTRQAIPLPSQVIPTGNQVIGLLGINIRDPLPIKSLHLNMIRIYNSNLILNADQICPSQHTSGISDGTIDSGKCTVESLLGGCQAPAKVRNRWPLVPGEEKYNPFYNICDTSAFAWDYQGVMDPTNGPCTGIRDPSVQQPFIAEYNPTVATIPRWEGPYSWMFQLSRGNPQNRAGS